MTLDEIKKLLEEKYMFYESLNDLEPDEEFDEFIKRKEEAQKSFDPLKYHIGLLSGSSGAIENCLL